MKKSKGGRIVVKVGSNVLTRSDGTLDITRVSALVDQVIALRQMGVDVILVSSGAVAAGRSEIKTKNKLDLISARQIYSAVGQVKLLNYYYSLFGEYNVSCGQVLATKEDFSTRRHYLNQRNCMKVMLENSIIPIVNENDTISVDELMFTDNDELSGLVATMMNCEKLIILSNIDGIYDGDPKLETSKVIKEIDPEDENIQDFIQTSRSTAGRGGMQTKYNIARKVSEEGIEVIIANGKKENILVDLISTAKDCIYTRFVPSKEKVSSVKKWIAHSDSFAKGEVFVNKCAKEALLATHAISLLPVGVVKITGLFEEGDIVKIIDESGVQIGLGRASYDSGTATKLVGVKNAKPVIHYDYLYIDSK